MVKYVLLGIALCVQVRANLLDSVGVVTQNQVKYMVYQIEKETVYAISRKFGVSVQTLYDINPEIRDGVRVGQKIKIPLRQIPDAEIRYHVVEKGQTLYAIAKKYNQPTDSLIVWNNLEKNELKVGAKIRVQPITNLGTNDKKSNNSRWQTVAVQPEKSQISKKQLKDPEPIDGLVVEKGNVSLYAHPEGSTFYYALHRSASVGSVIRVTNPANEVSVYARIMGKLPESVSAEVVLQLTQAGLQKLQTSEKGVFVVVELLPQ